MITRIYTVYDEIAEEAGPLFEAKNDGVANRQFQASIGKSIYKSEFTLYYVGTFDHQKLDHQVVKPTRVKVTMSTEVQNAISRDEG